EVPAVVGMSIRDAVATLQDARFTVTTVSLPPEVTWDLWRVTSISPEAGTLQVPGTQITITGFGL
ncbi:MAG TPA: PASTA domain-containing protein, partial [Microbacterium sp.]|nr:PASTA domain-containing protein [Microbacterium sp.]